MALDPINAYALQSLQSRANLATSVLAALDPAVATPSAPSVAGESPIQALEAQSDAVVVGSALSSLGAGVSAVSGPTVVPGQGGLLAIA